MTRMSLPSQSRLSEFWLLLLIRRTLNLYDLASGDIVESQWRTKPCYLLSSRVSPSPWSKRLKTAADSFVHTPTSFTTTRGLSSFLSLNEMKQTIMMDCPFSGLFQFYCIAFKAFISYVWNTMFVYVLSRTCIHPIKLMKRDLIVANQGAHGHWETKYRRKPWPNIGTGNMNMEVTQLEPYILKGSIKVIDRFFSVPVDYAKPDGPHIRIFARNLVPLGESREPSTDAAESDLPYLLYLQGGPGFGIDLSLSVDLGNALHKKKYQTLWLDPRGTDLSTPITADIFQMKQMDDEAIAKYLKHFRADNIVRDCETIRHFLLGSKKDPEARKWTILGQSFGGFCAATYLSFHSDGLKEVFIAGGIPPMVDSPDAVYEALVLKVEERNKVYYAKYPQDVRSVRRILGFLEDNNVVIPNGGNLTVSRWLQLGVQFGFHGGIDRVHQLVFRAITDLDIFGKLSYGLLDSVQRTQSFDTNPIYAVLHEPIYCQGRKAGWSAQRAIQKNDRFVWEKVKLMSDEVPIYFTGEMIFPDMFEDYHHLRPLRGAAELLANDENWPVLYDKEALKKNKVKVNAATYYDDMYVDFGLVQQTASVIGNVEQFITNQSFHDGIRKHMESILTTLFDLSKRERD